MSRREYPVAERYEETEADFYRRPRRDRNYDDFEVDVTRSRYPESRRAETVVQERDTVVSDRRGGRRLDFLRDDYGKTSNAGPLVLREDLREEDIYRRAPSRRRSPPRSRAPTEVIEKEKTVIEERERDRGPRGGRSEIEFKEVDKDEVIYRRDRTRSRPPPPREEVSKEEIDISIRRDDRGRSRPPPPRSEVRERDAVEEIRFRRGGGERPAPPRSVQEEDIDININERRRGRRGSTEVVREEIDIRERSVPPPRAALVAKKEEEWIIRRRRSSPPPPPPPEDYEKEEIIIRRKREVSPEPPPPEPPREPTPEPPPPPPVLEPIYRPPIIQEVITHHRHIDHGVERARSPTPPPPPPPPAPPSPPAVEEDELEIEIKRKGVRNGRAYEEDFFFERDLKESRSRSAVGRERSRARSVSRGPPPTVARRWEEDEVSSEADFYNRKVSARAYPGEAYNGATRDWGLVDVPPGTERVRMDGVGGGAQEITWQRYNGERRGKFFSGDRVYEEEWGRRGGGYASPPPKEIAPPPPAPAPPAPAPPAPSKETKEEIKISLETRHGGGETRRGKRDKMWTEVTKDLVIKEAVEEAGYEYEETDDFFYVMEYLRYEDVLRLVEVTEDIRRERRERIRELQWSSREEPPKLLTAPPPPPAPPSRKYDERFYEREYILDRDSRRYR